LKTDSTHFWLHFRGARQTLRVIALAAGPLEPNDSSFV
jgi:hypothetical protein